MATSLSAKGSTFSAQGLKFLISGGISAVVDLSLTYLFQIVVGFPPRGARSIGFIFGTLTAYLINRRWTFNAEASTKRFLQVVVLYTITYGVNVGGHSFLFNLFTHHGWHERLALVVAFLISQGVATVINFVVQRMFIFKR